MAENDGFPPQQQAPPGLTAPSKPICMRFSGLLARL